MAARPPKTLQQKIAQLEWIRHALVKRLERPDIPQERVDWIRGWWNRWCEVALRLKEEAETAGVYWGQYLVTTVTLRDALRHNLGGFHFPDAVNLAPPPGVGCRFGPDGTPHRTEFFGPVIAVNTTFDNEVDFERARFHGGVEFQGSVFAGNARFSGATFSGYARFDGASFGGETDFCAAIFFDRARFVGTTFSGRADFSWAIFSGNVWFDGATFSRGAWFGAARFSGSTRFVLATFSDVASFESAIFSGKARFGAATFSGNAWFGGVTARGEIVFDTVSCSKGIYFDDTIVSDGSKIVLRRIHCNGTLALRTQGVQGEVRIGESVIADALIVRGRPDESARWDSASFRYTHVGRLVAEHIGFAHVPDFVGFHVDGEVELEHVDIGDSVPAELAKLDRIALARELSARWRALKRLAEQGRHHYYTALFARNEMRARRLVDWHQRPMAALVGLIYGLLSDYGLSLWRPWAAWFASLVLFAMLYAGAAHPELRRIELGPCVSGPGMCSEMFKQARDLRAAALRASFFAQAPAVRLVATDATHTPFADVFGRNRIPGWVPIAVTLQTLISALLLFLFGLAVRNHFRVR